MRLLPAADDSFGELSPPKKRDALSLAAAESDYPENLIEKDVWVVETLRTLDEAPFGRHLTFKGGTSLSKVWRAIRRFSEDIDITYDIRDFASDLMGNQDDGDLLPSRSQVKRWNRAIRHRLSEWVQDVAKPTVETGLERDGFVAATRSEGEKLYISYEPTFDGYGFIRPEVTVDFGARSTGEPEKHVSSSAPQLRL